MLEYFNVKDPPLTATLWTLVLFVAIAVYVWLRHETGGKINKSDWIVLGIAVCVFAVPVLFGVVIGAVMTGLIALYTFLFSLFK
jgi:hypothetical protein